MEFGFGPGALEMLIQAKKDEKHKDYSIWLEGDLCQMSAQNEFLIAHGISVKFNNVYPCVRPCDKKKTFQLFWDYKCDGWWHYFREYEELEICTKEEFQRALDIQCERSKAKWEKEKKEKDW